MGKRYYCDYCGRAFLDNKTARRKHLCSSTHIQQRNQWYDQFKDKKQQLQEQLAKRRICKFYLQNVPCVFGASCRFRHMTDQEVAQVQEELQQETDAPLPTLESWLQSRKGSNTHGSDQLKTDHDSVQSFQYDAPALLLSLPYIPPSLRPPPKEGWQNFNVTNWK